jgi:hypothetical protein
VGDGKETRLLSRYAVSRRTAPGCWLLPEIGLSARNRGSIIVCKLVFVAARLIPAERGAAIGVN